MSPGKHTPPRIALRLLNLLEQYKTEFDINSDITELYCLYSSADGSKKANLWLWKQILFSIPVYLGMAIRGYVMDIKNNLKISLRNIRKHKAFSLINILGLSIGLTTSILILLFIKYELSYDKYHENSDSIYRVIMHQVRGQHNESEWYTMMPGALKYDATTHFPEVLRSTRVYWESCSFKLNNTPVIEESFFYVDREFLEIFTFPLLSGNAETALNDPYTLLLTEEMSEKYFGGKDPVGETLEVNNRDYTITGVLTNIPKNSHFTFDFISSFTTLYAIRSREYFDHWRWYGGWQTYVTIQPGTDTVDLGERMTALFKTFRDHGLGDEFHLQPITDIHLRSHLKGEMEPNSDIRYIYIFAAVAVLILLIACFNYMNLATARSAKRAKEVGIRKVVGAFRTDLIRQFMSESFLYVILAFVLSLVLIYFLLPVFSEFVQRDLHFSDLYTGGIIIGLIGSAVLLGLISGVYPAFFLSAFNPINIIKGKSGINSNKTLGFRNILVILQFSISVVLIASSLLINSQMEYIKNLNLGFKKDHIIYGITSMRVLDRLEPFIRELKTSPDIKEVYMAGLLPVTIYGNSVPTWEGQQEGEGFNVYSAPVGYNFLEFFEIELINGRNFSKDIITDSTNAFILNETAAKRIGWEDPIGKKFGNWQIRNGRVIGVVKDFHINSVHIKVDPIALCISKKGRQQPYYAVKVESGKMKPALELLEEKFKKFIPEYPFRYRFLDERIDSMYRSDQKAGSVLSSFTMIAIIISCLGLYGLVSFTTEQRIKEIGIRKVLGASVSKIILLLSKEFLLLVVIANIFAWPVAYYVVNKWLQKFAYRISPGVEMFIIAGSLALVIAFLTVIYRAVKAALSNPVDSLRYE